MTETNTNSEVLDEHTVRPWGLWATIGFSLIIIVATLVAQIAGGVFFAVVIRARHPDIELSALGANGLLVAVVSCMAAPVTVGLAFLFAKLRRGSTIKGYFCLNKASRKDYYRWSAAVLLLALCSDLLTTILHKPIVPDFMVQAYTTAGFMPLLWFAVIILAPLTEETLFRGFLFRGIEDSRIGTAGAIILSSLAWSALHLQYDLYGISTIFAGGILLGIARAKTNSIYVPILMHGIWSLIATIEAAIYVSMITL
jgi:membrane protease YdiL (CAAX protease family)